MQSTAKVSSVLRSPYQIPVFHRLLRRVFRPIFRLILRTISRVKITGLENVPRKSAYLIAANHVSLFEPPVLISFWPEMPEVIAADEIWKRPGHSLLVRGYRAIRICRDEYDRRAVQLALNALKSDRPVLIFPEGGRSHKPGLRRAQQGSAFLVEKSGVLVVPVGVSGTTDDFMQRVLRLQRPLLEVRIGPASHVQPTADARGESRHKTRQAAVDEIMTHIAAVLPPEYQGVYLADSEQLKDA